MQPNEQPLPADVTRPCRRSIEDIRRVVLDELGSHDDLEREKVLARLAKLADGTRKNLNRKGGLNLSEDEWKSILFFALDGIKASVLWKLGLADPDEQQKILMDLAEATGAVRKGLRQKGGMAIGRIVLAGSLLLTGIEIGAGGHKLLSGNGSNNRDQSIQVDPVKRPVEQFKTPSLERAKELNEARKKERIDRVADENSRAIDQSLETFKETYLQKVERRNEINEELSKDDLPENTKEELQDELKELNEEIERDGKLLRDVHGVNTEELIEQESQSDEETSTLDQSQQQEEQKSGAAMDQDVIDTTEKEKDSESKPNVLSEDDLDF